MRSLVISSPRSSAITTPRCSTITREQRRSSSALSDEHTTVAVPSRRGQVDEAVDVGLRPDVDALGRLVEHEHSRRAAEPAGHHDLLLVAARQLADDGVGAGRAYVELLDPHRGVGRLGRACGAARRDQNGVEVGDRQVLAHGLHAEQRIVGTIGRHRAQPGVDRRCAGRCGGISRPPTWTSPVAQRGGPTSRLASSSRPDPVSPAMPTTSPGWTSRLNGASSAPPTPRSDSTGFGVLRRRRRVGCGRRPRRRAHDRASGWRGPRGSARSRASWRPGVPSRRTVTRSAIDSTSSR